MNIEKINEIVEKNYNIIRNKLDINNNIYTTNLDEYEYDINISDFMLEMININHKIGKKEESSSNIIEKNWNEHLEYKKWMKEKESILKKECDDLREQIAEINKTIKKENKGVKDYLRKIIKK